ncbi:MAG: metallophosphoesterase [Deinococcota bacterium]
MKILAIADEVSPIVYSENFPKNLPPFDLVVSAGDMPGHVLEYVATKLTIQPLFVLGNHGNGYLNDPFTGEPKLPGGCINLHRKVIKFGDVIIAGIEGSARYRPGDLQYSEFEMDVFTQLMTPRLLYNKQRYGRAVDILLTHAPPKGPHEGSDFPHRGIPAFNRFAKRWKPKLHVHGHVHLNGVNAPRSYVTDLGMQVVNAFRFTLIDLDLDNPQHKNRPSHL